MDGVGLLVLGGWCWVEKLSEDVVGLGDVDEDSVRSSVDDVGEDGAE